MATRTDSSNSKESTCNLCLNIVKEFVMNPIIFMTVLGIVGNFAFDHKLPNILEGILKVRSRVKKLCLQRGGFLYFSKILVGF